MVHNWKANRSYAQGPDSKAIKSEPVYEKGEFNHTVYR